MQSQRTNSRAIIKAEEKERNRLGAELHDNVNQLLVSARLYIGLERKRKGEESEFLYKADEQLGMAIEEIRELTRKLSTAMVVNEGLLKSVKDIAENLLKLKNIELSMDMRESVIEKLSNEQQLMVYRIIQEQTSNILKYAETKEATISLQLVNNEAELVISDNGKGFDKTEQKLTGIGFSNIFTRVDAYGGKMKVISAPGKGCTLMITFPLQES